MNFDGGLDNLKVEEKDPARYILVQKKKESKDDEGNLLTYKVLVRDVEMAHKVIEHWKQSYRSTEAVMAYFFFLFQQFSRGSPVLLNMELSIYVYVVQLHCEGMGWFSYLSQ